MNILLLKPISDVYYVVQPNLGLGYIASVLEAGGHNVEILDAGREHLTWDTFTELVSRREYDTIGIQMFTHEVLSVKRHVEIIKQHSPDTTVVLGGAHISAEPRGTMYLIPADYGFVGEAEIGMERIVRRDYINHRHVPNLIWRAHGQIIVNDRTEPAELDTIRFPAWHLMDPRTYPIAPHGGFCKQPPVAPMIVSRGCPYPCTFCAGSCVTGRRVRYRSLKNVLEEIDLLTHIYGVREIHIEDDNFALNQQYVIDFCYAVKDLGLAFSLPNGVRLEKFDAGLLQLMERAGFYSMALGIESGSQRVLTLMMKCQTTALVRKKVELIKRWTNIQLTGFFMMGYPGETEEEILETIAFACSLKIDKASFMFVMPLPGSALWTYFRAVNPGPVDWEQFFYYRVVKGLATVEPKRLKALQRRAMVSFYARPKIVFGLLREIRSLSQVKMIFSRIVNILLK